jgi:hypothetical protein
VFQCVIDFGCLTETTIWDCLAMQRKGELLSRTSIDLTGVMAGARRLWMLDLGSSLSPGTPGGTGEKWVYYFQGNGRSQVL